MKKNYFYATIQEEFALLLSAVRSRSAQETESLRTSCEHRHKGLCLHLLRDFITPMSREDLYGISAAILAVFSTLPALSDADRRVAEQSVLLLSTDPFRRDETPLRRRDDLQAFWKDPPRNAPAARMCFSALDQLSERLLLAAIRNA